MLPQHFQTTVFRTLRAACAATFLAVVAAQAQTLLIDPSTTSGTSTIPAADVPYAVPTTSIWNRSSTGGFGSSIVYSDGTAATGVSITIDALNNSGTTAAYNFASPGASNAGNPTITNPGVFATNPVNNALFGPTVSNVSYGGVAAQVSGLSAGTYDIYLVAAYVGTATINSLPGGISPAQQDVWVFTDPSSSTLTTGTFGVADERLENSTRAAWTADNNYLKMTVTIDALNPVLYVVAEGAVNDSRRGWINSIQIVAVPEPSSIALLGLSAGCLLARRSRRQI